MTRGRHGGAVLRRVRHCVRRALLRKKDTFFKRFTAEGFYKLMNAMGAETVFNHADYRLMSKRALEGLAQFKEVNLFSGALCP